MRNASVWNRRSALMYTVGSWTLLGFLGFQSIRLMGKEKDEDQKEPPSEAAAQPSGPEGGVTTTVSEDRLTESVTYRAPGKSFYVTSTITYKPNFVPYSTRLYNYVQSFFEDTAGKEK